MRYILFLLSVTYSSLTISETPPINIDDTLPINIEPFSYINPPSDKYHTCMIRESDTSVNPETVLCTKKKS